MENAGLHKVLMPTNWKEMAVHVSKHWHDFDASELNTQNKFIEGALNMGTDYFGNSRKLQSLAH